MRDSYFNRLVEKVDRYLSGAKPVKGKGDPYTETTPSARRMGTNMLFWSSSPILERILGDFEEQRGP